MTEAEYWRIFDLIGRDVRAAVNSHHAYQTINTLLLDERDVYDRINLFPEFWQLNAYALQSTFFISFGRIFDNRRDTYSLPKLLDATVEHPGFFSKAALLARKRELSHIHGADPDWLSTFVSAAWEPTRGDLMALKTALEPHTARFSEAYQPIRHAYFAHTSMETDEEIFGRFQRASVQGATEILRFIHTLMWSIRDMAWNGNEPNLSNSHDYDLEVRKLSDQTAILIRNLPSADTFSTTEQQ